MVATTLLQLPLLAASQAQKHVTHNEALLALDGLVQLTAISYSTAAEPGSPVDGDLYLLPPGKTGAHWGGAANHAIAHYFDGVWHFHQPREGWTAYLRDASQMLIYRGSAWQVLTYPAAARPAFFAYLSASQANKTGDGTAYDVPFDAEQFDQQANHAGGVFTAPMTGLYLFGGIVRLSNLGAGHAQWEANVVTSSTTYVPLSFDPHNVTAGGILFFPFTTCVPLSAGDTAKLRVAVYNSSKTVQIDGAGIGNRTHFWGFQIA